MREGKEILNWSQEIPKIITAYNLTKKIQN